MRAININYATSPDIHENKILSKQICLSLVDGNPTHFPSLHLQPIGTRRAVINSLQEAGSISFILAAYLIFAPQHNTPPHVDISQYRNVRRLSNATPEIWWQRALILARLHWPISQKDPKKNRKRPVPTKPTKPETEKPKPDREGDKGKRKGRDPKTNGLVTLVDLLERPDC